MSVPISKLTDKVVHDIVLAVEQGRAKLIGKHKIQTNSPTIQFSMEVYLDESGFVEGDETLTVTPDTETTTTQGESTTRQTQEAFKTIEMQTTTPGMETTTQDFGRSSESTVEEAE